jgi:hypothetical protein
MPDLMTALREYDDGMLPALAQVWNVNITNLKTEQVIMALHQAMLEPQRAAQVWNALTDAQRGALQTLISGTHSVAEGFFERVYKDIPRYGRKLIDEKKPHRQNDPARIAEALYYRGLICRGFKQTNKGMEPVIYLADDLAAVLPSHQNSYAHLKQDLPPPPPKPTLQTVRLYPVEDEYIEDPQQADTSIVDDLCTLLAYIRVVTTGVEEDGLLPVDIERLMPHLFKPDVVRLNFMLNLAISAEMISTQDGRAYARKPGGQRWLELPRSQQIKLLMDAWRESHLYVDLWHVPGLFTDADAGSGYDPLAGRDTLVRFLAQIVPHQEWWSIEDFIDAVKTVDPDFQRPGGDYDSWYIRNQQGEYLRGFESWDAVEGALLDYYLRGPMHWLGLTDITEEAARLTAYGRAFIGLTEWPQPPDAEELIAIGEDGIVIASRRVSRLDRYQLARFSTWLGIDEMHYRYRIDAPGIQQAAQQGITTAQIATFLKRHAGEKPLPAATTRLLENWQGGSAAAEVSFEQLLVLRTVAPETLDRIYNDPALRRYLGTRLGPMACVIRAGHEDALRLALGEAGIAVE